ncbi:MAG: FumA C-terminus/TtdB family hydratase beta subunit [Anaerosomatales bacterium]|nr:FumA C-terminus/TtdB family hydratase beta subunit [Anaerosomatales bacterium]
MSEARRGPGGTGPTEVSLPATREVLATLRAGDEVVLTGPVYTARDATHERLLAGLRSAGELPHGLAGQTLLYAGPTPPAAGRPSGALGPTTAKRMDRATPALLEAGIVATIGKGPRSAEVRRACAGYGAVYFAAVGGAAALLAMHVTAAETVAYPELGTEALVRLQLDRFPAFVAIDARGEDLYLTAALEWRGAAGIDGGDA